MSTLWSLIRCEDLFNSLLKTNIQRYLRATDLMPIVHLQRLDVIGIDFAGPNPNCHHSYHSLLLHSNNL